MLLHSIEESSVSDSTLERGSLPMDFGQRVGEYWILSPFEPA